jgi:hypothetical protein
VIKSGISPEAGEKLEFLQNEEFINYATDINLNREDNNQLKFVLEAQPT